MIYGYARISTKKQSIERQVRNIKDEEPKAIIIEEVYTGTTISRKQFNKLVNNLKVNDTIIFDSVSRMSRNAEEGVTIYKKLFKQGITLKFIKEPHINTDTYKKALSNNIELTNTNLDYILEGINKYLLSIAEEQIKIAFSQAEKEVNDLRQRTREGIETARINGKTIGLKVGSKLTTKKSIEAKKIIRKHLQGELSNSEIMKIAGISRNSYYKYKKEILNEKL